jgi:hypothetical protein
MTRFALLFFVAACAWGQTASTQILGLVTDATGKVVLQGTIGSEAALASPAP